MPGEDQCGVRLCHGARGVGQNLQKVADVVRFSLSQNGFGVLTVESAEDAEAANILNTRDILMCTIRCCE